MDKQPVCVCPYGYEEIENQCVPVLQRGKVSIIKKKNQSFQIINLLIDFNSSASCDQANNCSPLATCDYSQERQSYVCTCAAGYIGMNLFLESYSKSVK